MWVSHLWQRGRTQASTCILRNYFRTTRFFPQTKTMYLDKLKTKQAVARPPTPEEIEAKFYKAPPSKVVLDTMVCNTVTTGGPRYWLLRSPSKLSSTADKALRLCQDNYWVWTWSLNFMSLIASHFSTEVKKPRMEPATSMLKRCWSIWENWMLTRIRFVTCLSTGKTHQNFIDWMVPVHFFERTHQTVPCWDSTPLPTPHTWVCCYHFWPFGVFSWKHRPKSLPVDGHLCEVAQEQHLHKREVSWRILIFYSFG